MPSKNMDDSMQNPEEQDWFERENRCRKSLRTVMKALMIRILATAILIWALICTDMDIWVVGLIILVLLINLTGLLPLLSEWKKQRIKLKQILSEE